ncbi:MAG: hypothetical protein HXY18_18180 [Bryobacteraceae bacterium]|nr:hypothetical protein [Bryobacteraceae bacterium]
MRRSIVLWILAFLITVASAVYQRLTGPTHPLRGETTVGGVKLRYRLIRSHGGEGDAPVRVEAADKEIRGTVGWKRHKTRDAWSYAEMRREGEELVGMLPHQPPAGKLDYRVILAKSGERVTLAGSPVTIRFKGDVPMPVLVVHVIAMFGGMLVATRAGLEFWAAQPRYGPLVLWTLGLLFVGGLILGPVVQKYAFGEYWTGWPFGTDLTDNKTAVAWLAWVAAWFGLRKGARPGWWVLAASVVTLVVFAIPHSLFGSELKYE